MSCPLLWGQVSGLYFYDSMTQNNDKPFGKITGQVNNLKKRLKDATACMP
jgi:hypothetical protein